MFVVFVKFTSKTQVIHDFYVDWLVKIFGSLSVCQACKIAYLPLSYSYGSEI